MQPFTSSEAYQTPRDSNWFPPRVDEDVLSYSEGFLKQELFEDVDLANIPITMMAGTVDASDVSSTGFPTAIFSPLTGIHASHPPAYPPQPSTAPFETARAPMNINEDSVPSFVPVGRRKPSTPGSKHHSFSHESRRKRKSTCSATTASSRSSISPPPTAASSTPPRKTTHNLVEKRYRTNLNDKIAELRDAVPSLRVMVQRLKRGRDGLDDTDLVADEEVLGGLTPAHKLNKATVLSKATEYIGYLERNNEALIRENSHLRNRVAWLEDGVMGQGPRYGAAGVLGRG